MVIKTGYNLTDEQISEAYSKITKKITMPSYFYPFVKRLVLDQKFNNLLDVGCGNGYLLKEINCSIKNKRLYGVEFSEKLYFSSKKDLNNLGIYIKRGDINNLPFKSKSFDLITVTEVIEHIKTPKKALKEIKRVLKDEGTAIITFPNMSAYDPFRRIVEKYIPFNFLKMPFLPWEHPLRTFQPVDTAYEYEEIISLIKKSGLKIKKIYRREFFPSFTTEIPLFRRLYRKIAYKFIEPYLDKKTSLKKRAYRLFLVIAKQ